MKFLYQYHTRENELRDGVIGAANRDAAYAALRARGIRPSRVEAAPGLWNRILGVGRRGLAIAVLAFATLATVALWTVSSRRAAVLARASAERETYEPRSQIYGDPELLAEACAGGWAVCFADPAERVLAAYAVPGRRVDPAKAGAAALTDDAFRAGIAAPVAPAPGDFAEYAKMKRIVNFMKREARAYLDAGGTPHAYLSRLDERQREEVAHVARVRAELTNTTDAAVWRDRNASLRAMGLPMVHPPQ